MAMKLAAPDIVSFDYRRPSGTLRCPDDNRSHLDRLSGDGGTSKDLHAVCGSVSVDPDTSRLVQSSVSGDWQFVSPGHPHPELLEPDGRHRRQCGSTRPQDMGVGPSDFHVGSHSILTAASSASHLGISSPVSGLLVSSPTVCGYYHHGTDAEGRQQSAANMDLTLPSRGVTYPLNIASRDDISRALYSDRERPLADTCILDRYEPSSSFGSQPISGSSPGLDESAAGPIPTSPSGVRSNNGVLLCSLSSSRDSGYRTGPDDGVTTTSGLRRAELVQSCSLSTQFASDADLEADLLSARLLREFREAIRSAVDSISSNGCRPGDAAATAEIPPCRPASDSGRQSSMSVERVEEVDDGGPSCRTVVETRTESARFRASNIPTLHGLSRCSRLVVSRDDLTTVTRCVSSSPVTSNVLRHRRSLPDAGQLLRPSSSSRDAVVVPSTSRPTRTRSSLVIGTSVSVSRELIQRIVSKKVKVPALTTPYSIEDCRRRGKRV